MKADNLLSFAGGALLGICAALLLAPASGKETRAKIKRTAQKEYDEIKDKIQNLKKRTEAELAALKEEMQGLEYADELQEELDDIAENTKNKIDNI